jgi:hypothetical protein
VRPHLHAFQENLAMTAALVRESLQEPGTDEERSGRFVERIRLEMRRRMPDAQVDAYFSTSPFHLLWLGWRGIGARRVARGCSLAYPRSLVRQRERLARRACGALRFDEQAQCVALRRSRR